MNSERLKCILIANMASVLFLFGLRTGEGQTTIEIQTVSVFSHQYETVFQAESAFLTAPDSYKGMDKNSVVTLRMPFAALIQGMKYSGTKGTSELLKNSKVVFLGAKDFLPPAGLGPVHSTWCYAVILKDSDKHSAKWYFRKTARMSFHETQMWKWSAQLGEFGEEDAAKPSIFYAAQISGTYLLIANDPEDLLATAKGLALRASDKSRDVNIFDWKLLHEHEVWAYRRLLRNAASDNVASGLSGISPDIAAIEFFVDFTKKEHVIRVFSSAEDRGMEPSIETHGELSTFIYQGEHVWETKFPFLPLVQKNAASNVPLSLVMDYFGFGLYI